MPQNSFNKAAKHYDRYALVQYEIGMRLLQRVYAANFHPNYILDVGAGTGKLTNLLQEHFKKSKVIGVDLAFNMLQQAAASQTLTNGYTLANMQALPFSSQSIDLIFSNFTLQWAQNLQKVLSEFKRVLSLKGMLFFTTVGSDTLKELRESYKAVSDTPSVHSFYDMHDIGDVMLHCGFQDPVVDKEIITVQYKSVATLLKDLKGIGSFNLSPHKSPGCMTPRRLQRVYDAYEKFKDPQGFYPVTYEIIYGHAMSPTLYRSDEEGIVHIPANKIPVLP